MSTNYFYEKLVFNMSVLRSPYNMFCFQIILRCIKMMKDDLFKSIIHDWMKTFSSFSFALLRSYPPFILIPFMNA